MDKLAAIRIYDGQNYSDEIPVTALAENIQWDQSNTLVDILGSIDLTHKGDLQNQIDELNIRINNIHGNVISVNGRTGAVILNAADIGAGTGNYNKPVGGIPKSDLASSIQTSLGKADTALQSYTETDPTVPAWAKQPNKPTYTAQEVGALPADAQITVEVDNTLSIQGAAADAKKVGNELTQVQQNIGIEQTRAETAQALKINKPVTNPNGTQGQILQTDGQGGTTWVDKQTDEQIAEVVSDWLDDHVTPGGSTIIVDNGLNIQGAAADAKKTGDQVTLLKGELGQKANIKTSTISAADLDITDFSGNVIARFENGHIKTKEFDSSNLINAVSNMWTGRCTDRFPTLTKNKTVVLDEPNGFSLTAGVIIAIRNIGNNELNPCLNVNGTGNIPVYISGSVPSEDYYLNQWDSGLHFFQYTEIGGGRWILNTIDPVMWTNLINAVALKNSPNLTGIPTAPTAPTGTNNTQLATTAFVQQEITTENSSIIRSSTASTADLDITDYYGNVIARFEDGHIQTKEFNSSDIVYQPFSGKKWACIGDSLTEVNVRTTKHYHDYIAELTGINVVNHGHSGAGYYARSFDYAFMNEVQRIPTDSDVITIFGSINDVFHTTIPLGDVTDATTSTLCGCINIAINNLYARIPVAYLGIITPTPCWYQASGVIDDWTPSNPGNDLELYSEALIEICKRRSIPCLDLYHLSNLRPQESAFRTLAFSKDSGNGIHPDETGHKLIAARFLEFIKTLILY